jgi:hypothetical protein
MLHFGQIGGGEFLGMGSPFHQGGSSTLSVTDNSQKRETVINHPALFNGPIASQIRAIDTVLRHSVISSLDRRNGGFVRSAGWDGEIVVPAADGTTDFSVLQNELKGKSTKIVLVAFDLLYLNGFDLRKRPLVERKKHLKKIIEGTDLQFSESFEVDG